MVPKLEENWGSILKTHDGHCPTRECVSVYMGNELFPSLICKVLPDFKPRCGAFTQQLSISKEVKLYSIWIQSKTLTLLRNESKEEGLLKDCDGVVAQVRLVEVTKGPKKLHFLMFCGNVGALEPNSKSCSPKGCEFLLFYNTAIGRKMCK